MHNKEISKAEFKAKISEYIRQIESTGITVIATDSGKSSIEVRQLQAPNRHSLDVLRGLVVLYDRPTAPVALNA